MSGDKKPNLTVVTGNKDEAVAAVAAISGILDPVANTDTTYDLPPVEQLLDVILHAGVNENEELPFWRCPIRVPKIGYPVTEESFITSTFNDRFKRPSRCYFGTSTLRPDGDRLRNKQEHIVTTRCIVLDDIGTKIPVSRIKLPPTYIIESSKGNFQYGYVFDTPIDRPDASAELVSLVYSSGLSDSGGKMANKLVRLPCGVNGKDSPDADKTLFPVALVELHADRLYSPQALLDGLGIPAKWDEIYSDAESYAAGIADRATGAAHWTDAVAPTVEGVVDPILEFLIEQGDYVSDTGEFVTIRCPNAHAHTSGGDTAGYRPVGRGDKPNTRAFKCFHDHCANYTTSEFLADLAARGAPASAVRDDAYMLTGEWVYDSFNHAVWRIRGVPYPTMYSVEAFKTLFPHSVEVVQPDGKTKLVAQHRLWHYSRARVNVHGAMFDPSTPSRLITHDSYLMVNTYTPPKWGIGDIDPDHLRTFLDFIEYLIPTKEECEYFLNWLACKAQNMGFRGAGIVMVAKQQGTGRGTLADMIATLFGVKHMVNMPFDKLIGDNTFNEWQLTPFVVTDETLNTGEAHFYRAYERLKELVDLRPKLTTINPKYGKKHEALVHSSYLMFSNHSGALGLGVDDRRFYVINNALERATPEYFTELNAWLGKLDDSGKPCWAASVWRWLRARKVNVGQMMAPVAQTAGKRMMAEATRSPIDVLVEAMFTTLNERKLYAFIKRDLSDLIEEVVMTNDDFREVRDTPNWRRVMRKKLDEETLNVLAVPVNVGGKSYRLRLRQNVLSDDSPISREDISDGKITGKSKVGWMRDQYAEFMDTKDEIIASFTDKLGDYDI